MKCLANNNQGKRCGNDGQAKRLFFCNNHSIIKNNWSLKDKIKWIFCITIFPCFFFVLEAIITWETEEYWSKSSIRKELTSSEELGSLPTQLNNFIDTSKYNVLLLPFGASSRCSSDAILCEREIFKAFQSDRIINSNDFEVIFGKGKDDITAIYTLDDLAKISKKSFADLIIYGDFNNRCGFDSTVVQVDYYLNSKTNIELPIFIGQIRKEKFKYINEFTNGTAVGNLRDIIYWISGFQKYDSYDLKGAIEVWERISMKEKYEYNRLFHLLGTCYHYLNENGKSIDYFSLAIKVDDLNYEHYLDRASVYKSMQKFNSSLNDYEKVVELTNGKFADVFLNMANTYSFIEKPTQAFEFYKKAKITKDKYDNHLDAFDDLYLKNLSMCECLYGKPTEGAERISNSDLDINDRTRLMVLCAIASNNKDLSQSILLQFDNILFSEEITLFDMYMAVGLSNLLEAYNGRIKYLDMISFVNRKNNAKTIDLVSLYGVKINLYN